MRMTRIAAAIALLLAPTGVVMGAQMEHSGEAVEHHTTFVEMVVNEDERDRPPGFAAVAGLVTCKSTSSIDNAVLWFNDQLLFRTGRQGPDASCLADRNATHVWATEDEAPDPRDNPSLQPTGKVYEFTDPNDRHWVVREYVYHVIHGFRQESTDVTVGSVSASVEGETEVRAVEFHTWVVELKDPTMDPTIGEQYNFVNLIDLRKLTFGADGEERHTGEAGDPRDGNSHDAPREDEEHRFPHEHDTAEIDLRIGGAPDPGSADANETARAEITVVTPEELGGPEGSAGPLTVENDG